MIENRSRPSDETGTAPCYESDASVTPADYLPPKTSKARHVRLTRASEIEPEPVVWAWEDNGHGRIPAGSLSIAAGREGTGKSSYGVYLAAQITKGQLPGSYYGTSRNVFYVAAEDSWRHTLVPRLIAAGADLDRVYRFDVITHEQEESTLSLPHDNILLEAKIRDEECALVVLDPLMSTVGDKIDTHRERDVRGVLDPIAKIADRTGALILGIAHFNKSNGTDPASLITGSGAFKNVPRSVFGFARDDHADSGDRIMTQVKNSLGRDDLPSWSYTIESAEIPTKKGPTTTGKFTFTGLSERTVTDALRDSHRDSDQLEMRRDAATFIKNYLLEAGGSAPASEVIKAGSDAGYAKSALLNARKKAAETRSVGFAGEKQHLWELTVDTSVDTVGTTDLKLVPTVSKAVSTANHAESPTPQLALGTQPRPCARCDQVPTDSGGIGTTGLCVPCEMSN